MLYYRALDSAERSAEIGDWIADLPYLGTIFIANVTFTKPISQQIASLPRLYSLNVLFSKNVQLPVIPSNVFLPLTELIIYDSDLSGAFPDLGPYPNLTRLELSGTQVDGTIPASLGSHQYLSSITLVSGRLSGTIPKELGQLSKLRFLYLYGNSLTGTIPPELASLPLLIQFHVNDNKLNGTIPRELASQYISYQRMKNNQFTGTIPVEYASMTYLYELDVSGNKLTGTIPTGLASLPYLTLFNVSNNPLSGCYNVTFQRANQCDVSSTNLCCIPTNPQCFTTAVQCKSVKSTRVTRVKS